MSKSPLIVFDFDGTIANSLDIGIQLANELAPIFRYPEIESIETVRQHSGVRYVMSQMHWSKLPFWVLMMKRRINEHIPDIELYPGMRDVLRELSERYRLGIIGGGRPTYHKAILENHEADVFDFKIGNNGASKHRTLNRLISNGENPQQMIYIGDDVKDVEAAHRSGIHSIAVTWGITHRDRLEHVEPTAIVEAVHEITVQIERILEGGAEAVPGADGLF